MGDLNEVIQRENAACQFTELLEPTSLPAARRKLREETARLGAAEAEADASAQQLMDYPKQSMWHRLWGPAKDSDRQALETRLEQLQRARPSTPARITPERNMRLRARSGNSKSSRLGIKPPRSNARRRPRVGSRSRRRRCASWPKIHE